MNEKAKELLRKSNFTDQDIEDISPGFETFLKLSGIDWLLATENKGITAQEAKELAGPSFEEIVEGAVEGASNVIRAAATEKNRSVKLHESFWVHGGYKSTPEWKEAKKRLESAGFNVSFYYQELSMAVDMYTLVKW